MKQTFQVTDRQKSVFEYMQDSTLDQAIKVATEKCEFYKVETRVYRNGFVMAKFFFENGQAVRRDS